MDLNGIKIQNYIYHFFKEMDDLYSLVNKDILFVHYDPSIDNARALIELGANKVHFVNPEYSYEEIENGKIVLISPNDNQLSLIKDNSIDLVIGLEILEHINDVRTFFSEIKRVVKPNGDIELQGSPMWTSHYGHHLWIENKYIFYEDSNPFEPWEHLLYDSQEDMTNALIKKGISEEDSQEITRWIYDPIEINRLSPSEIIEAITDIPTGAEKGAITKSSSALFETYKKDSWLYIFKRHYDRTEINEHFNSVLSKYSEQDLKTAKLVLKMKKLNYEAISPQNLELPESNFNFRDIILSKVSSDIKDIIIPFINKHNVFNKNVLNLSCYQNELITKLFLAFGAKSVTSVSPTIISDKEFNDEQVISHKIHFENLDEINNKYDVVFGIDTLNYIYDLNKFCLNLKNAVDITTGIYLSGLPYTSSYGHFFSTANHHFYDDSNPLECWQHLSLNTKNEFEKILLGRNVEKNEIDQFLNSYFADQTNIRLSPSEIEDKFKSYMNIHMYRIFKYMPKNQFYEKALEKYSDDDLNTEKMIISSDFPTINWLDELQLDQYLEGSLSDINLKYKLNGKRVLNVSPYINHMITEGLESLRATEVVSVGGYYTGYELRGGKNVRRVNQDFEDIANISGQFDIIYGLDVLEHVKDVKKFYNNLKKLIKDDGIIFLQGSPLWPSNNGHNYLLNNLDCGMLQTGEGSPCLDNWEHLAYDSKEELKSAMINKNFTEHDAELVSDFVFNSDEINRKSFSDFIDILNEIDGVYYGTKKILHYAEENEFYQKASEKYTHEQLRTKELKLYIRKKLS